MPGFVDLHCHWVAAIDDGARSVAESVELLRGLKRIGFAEVVATPHMRPGMFDNTKADLERAYAATRAEIDGLDGLPALALSSEHWFDDTVFARLVAGEALPYPGGTAALVEFPTTSFPARVTHRFFDLRQRRIRPVLAHPERYEPVFRDIAVLDPIVDGGTVLLLDVAALAGKYGRAPRRAAEELLEEGYYYAACSDAHAPRDVADVEKGIRALFDRVGDEEATFLLAEGPRSILEGRVEV
ncbi:MAG TPA: CpsB/CapC family capsule biosynthesis tyrosine phosphatase [Minicystis sp.]|nr:CpsB/CapC family capsule biosynthesis tyrosine phosphatase [Minicystis sp.]